MVQVLLNANFIFKVKYIEWIFNIMLVKKAFEKWKICVDYTDLYRACPKDSAKYRQIGRHLNHIQTVVIRGCLFWLQLNTHVWIW